MITRRDLIKEKLADFVKVHVLLAECYSKTGALFESKKNIEKAGAAILIFRLMGAGIEETKQVFAPYYLAYPKYKFGLRPSNKKSFTFTKSVKYLIEMGLHFSNMEGESEEGKEISRQNSIAGLCIFEMCGTKEEKDVWLSFLKNVVFSFDSQVGIYVTAPRMH